MVEEFVIDMWESIARGRYICESPSDHGLHLYGERGLEARERSQVYHPRGQKKGQRLQVRKMPGLYREETLREGHFSPWAGKFRLQGL